MDLKRASEEQIIKKKKLDRKKIRGAYNINKVTVFPKVFLYLEKKKKNPNIKLSDLIMCLGKDVKNSIL